MFSAEEGAFYVSETVGQILTEQLRNPNSDRKIVEYIPRPVEVQ